MARWTVGRTGTLPFGRLFRRKLSVTPETVRRHQRAPP